MRIDVVTIFPAMIEAYAQASILGRAQAAGVLTVRAHDLRDFSDDKHRNVDDTPYGGGAGMVLQVAPIHKAVEAVRRYGESNLLQNHGHCERSAAISDKKCEGIASQGSRFRGTLPRNDLELTEIASSLRSAPFLAMTQTTPPHSAPHNDAEKTGEGHCEEGGSASDYPTKHLHSQVKNLSQNHCHCEEGGSAATTRRSNPGQKSTLLRSTPRDTACGTRVILLSAKGKRYTQRDAERLARYEQLVLICGRYEGVDERVAEHIADEEISIGDYVLTGGELGALVIADSVARLVPGVLGNAASATDESHAREGYTEYPHYTKPAVYNGWRVPEVLLSGDHGAIAQWRAAHAGQRDE